VSQHEEDKKKKWLKKEAEIKAAGQRALEAIIINDKDSTSSFL
jgi:hypothetical protein